MATVADIPPVTPKSNSKKKTVQRAFKGLAGSPLAVARALKGISKSDHTLREPRTPDKEEPVGFNEWWDSLGQRHAEIDLDCDFQPYAHDVKLRGHVPEGTQHLRPSAAMTDPDRSVLDDFRVDLTAPKDKRKGVLFGLLEGDRPVKRRRATNKTWWIFESELLRDFLKAAFDKHKSRAEAAALVIYHYYFRNREDKEIYEETSLFKDEKSLKNFRQRLVDEGNELYPESLRPHSCGHGYRGRRTGGKQCNDPECPCHKNEVSHDFSSR